MSNNLLALIASVIYQLTQGVGGQAGSTATERRHDSFLRAEVNHYSSGYDCKQTNLHLSSPPSTSSHKSLAAEPADYGI